MPLAKACVIARRLGYAEMRARAEERTFGVWRDTLYGGQRQPARDPEAMACPPELREILGYHKDAWLIVDGKVQWEREWIEPPVSLLEKFFTTFPDLTPTTKQQITLNGQMNVGVGIVSRGRYEGPVPTVPPEPVEHPLPEVEIVPTLPAPTSASITDQDLEDLLGPELVAPERAAIAATAATKAVAAIEPEEPPTPALAPAMAKEPEPAAPAPASSPTAPDPDASVLNGPSQPVITELQRSLLAKLEEARARRKAEQEQKS
ncbi:hypothetical protein QNJ95_42680 [Bradyrhizobium elkanii]|uniref:hypothetical protein n=1 Tax=Bradyrhizobium TaxID=374 RepID=UPI002711FC66|nr:hypothetical protein [Bradyrhizobium elkanii]WLA39477.1 hypothetical protein QNJ95_42680 [Bradyrhizobium elkanii]